MISSQTFLLSHTVFLFWALTSLLLFFSVSLSLSLFFSVSQSSLNVSWTSRKLPDCRNCGNIAPQSFTPLSSFRCLRSFALKSHLMQRMFGMALLFWCLFPTDFKLRWNHREHWPTRTHKNSGEGSKESRKQLGPAPVLHSPTCLMIEILEHRRETGALWLHAVQSSLG